MSGDEPGTYSFTSRDLALLSTADLLLAKLLASGLLLPAQLASVAKLQHVLSRLPRVTPRPNVTLLVAGPTRRFGEIETSHYWEVAVEGTRLSLSSGGHFHRPSTGGDNFTTMQWTAEPGEPADFSDYRDGLSIVPDVQSFAGAVRAMDLAAGEYTVEVFDPDNALLDDAADADEDAMADGQTDGDMDEDLDGRESAPQAAPADAAGSPRRPAVVTSASRRRVNEGDEGAFDDVERTFAEDTTERWSCREGDFILWATCTMDSLLSSRSRAYAVADFWEMRAGQYVTLTNRLCDVPDWFSFHPSEVAGSAAIALEDTFEADAFDRDAIDGPNIWRVAAGHRLAWVRPTAAVSRHAGTGLLQVVTFRANALVLGEPLPRSMEELHSFGSASTPELPPAALVALRAALAFIQQLGTPPELATEWLFGA